MNAQRDTQARIGHVERILIRWVPPLVLLLGFPFALYYLSRLDLAALPSMNLASVAGAAFLYIAAVLLLVNSWRRMLRWGLELRIGTAEGLGHVGMTLIGKFLPGKVWGFLSRGMALKRNVGSVVDIAVVSLSEQILLAHAGIIVAVICGAVFLWLRGEMAWLVVVAVLASAVSIFVGAGIFARLHVPVGLIIRKFRSSLRLDSPVWSNIAGVRYQGIVLLYCIYWMLQCLVVMALCSGWYLDTTNTHSIAERMLITFAAVPFGVLAGFVVLWAPSGIGVREGVIVAILVSVFKLDQAIAISLVFRIWSVCWDLILGGWALLYFRFVLVRQTSASDQESK